ncbi:MAG: LacI family transcriptional regulator [Eubacterium sp.]|nr:LacI family transcriptional regulator [Eubacterium sp.]
MSIKKIADMVGVSASTVSRVLNKPDYKCSSKELQEKIINAAREINYIPNEAAINLRKGEKEKSEIYKFNILVTRKDNADPFFSELIRFIELEIHKNLCMLTQIWYRPDFADEIKCVGINIKQEIGSLFAEEKSDGLILLGKCCTQVIRELKSKWKNIVSVDRDPVNPQIDEVSCDSRKISATAVEYLIRLGHRKIGYVGSTTRAVFQGYQDALFDHNIEMNIDHIIKANTNESDGYKAMKSIIQMQDKPTGIYCANDIIAIGMLKALNMRKNRYYVPSVISSDDISESKYTKPMLTTISLPKEEMAKFALDLLIDRINNGHRSSVKIELEGSLVIRSSCSPLNDPEMIEYYI